jgi:hypothetical protein
MVQTLLDSVLRHVASERQNLNNTVLHSLSAIDPTIGHVVQ